MNADWKWKFGVISGVGECAWQSLITKIRRITRFASLPDGRVAIGPCNFYRFISDKDFQWDAEGMVVLEVEADERFKLDLDGAWSNIARASGLPPPHNGNGGPRLIVP